MSPWRFYNPVDLRFGEGVLDTIAQVLQGRRYVLVTHPDAVFLPLQARLMALAGAPVAVVNKIEPNPSLRLLETLCSGLDQAAGKAEVIVALGGGSVIDTAKFLAAGHLRFAIVRDYLEGRAELTAPALPIIAIPTTAGTGSDLTKWATIWDPETGRKLSLNRPDLFPEVALVDPALTHSLPWSLTLACGLDALSHALESNWNRNANPVTRHYARAACQNILISLPLLKADLSDPKARAMLSRGATFAGLAFSNTMTALAHNISYSVTLEKQVVHGIACSFSLPLVMEAALGSDGDCDAIIGEIFECEPSKAPEKLRLFLHDLGIATRPEAYGYSASAWSDLVRKAITGPRGQNFIGTIERFPHLV